MLHNQIKAAAAMDKKKQIKVKIKIEMEDDLPVTEAYVKVKEEEDVKVKEEEEEEDDDTTTKITKCIKECNTSNNIGKKKRGWGRKVSLHIFRIIGRHADFRRHLFVLNILPPTFMA